VCHYTPESKRQSFSGVIHFAQPPECSRRAIQPEKSCHLFWDRKGFFLVDFMPKNAEAYCNILKKKSEEPFRTAEGEC
jgi:hypothetical protein